MRRLIVDLIVGIIGVWLAGEIIKGVVFKGTLTQLLLVGSVLGLVHFFLKPLITIVTFPLRLLTLGLFSFFIDMFLLWLVDVMFAEFDIIGLKPLFWSTLLIWGLGIIIPLFIPKPKPKPIQPN